MTTRTTPATTPTPRPMGDRGQGRKALADGVESVNFTLRLTPELRAKLDRLGGDAGAAAWVRDRIQSAKWPAAS